MKFLRPDIKAKRVYTDNSKELGKAVHQLCTCHDTVAPCTPAANGVIERAVRRVKEGTRAALLQSGLPDRWWHKAMTCYYFLRNIHDIMVHGSTLYKMRYGEDLRGPIIPFWRRTTLQTKQTKRQREVSKVWRPDTTRNICRIRSTPRRRMVRRRRHR